MRFWTVVVIAMLVAAFGARYLGLNFLPTAMICLAVGFVAMLVQAAFPCARSIVAGHDPFGSGEERET